MPWSAWIAVALTLVRSGWMVLDGTRALVAGDYVTPHEGPYAGRLGPWARVVEAAGISPRSTPMKVTFVVLGVAGLVAAGLFLSGNARGRAALIATAAATLWYLPVGSATSVLVILLLLLLG